jgi:diguanylate cyclase (GGDEF)-like protein
MVALVQIGGAVAYVHLMGTVASYWLFASSVANFYLLSWKRALTINVVCCFIVAWLIRGDPDFMLRFVINYLLVNLFLFVYTYELEKKTAEVAHLLYRDPLTGTGNRLALDAALTHVRSHKERYDTPVTLLMLDLDHFKQVNDSHGHTVGDRLLVDFAKNVDERLRATDSLYRFGGEEFMIIAENTHLDEAGVMAEAIRKRVAGTPYPPTDGITLSIGLAELATGESSDSWLNRTDRALYRAKHDGRNRIAVENEAPVESSSPGTGIRNG